MWKPINNYLILQKEESPKQTSSGILLTSTKEEVLALGRVIGICDKQETAIRLNDVVVYNRKDTEEINFEKSNGILIKEHLIMAIKEHEGK